MIYVQAYFDDTRVGLGWRLVLCATDELPGKATEDTQALYLSTLEPCRVTVPQLNRAKVVAFDPADLLRRINENIIYRKRCGLSISEFVAPFQERLMEAVPARVRTRAPCGATSCNGDDMTEFTLMTNVPVVVHLRAIDEKTAHRLFREALHSAAVQDALVAAMAVNSEAAILEAHVEREGDIETVATDGVINHVGG